MPYRRRGRTTWFVSVPTRTGRVKRSAGTTHRGTARAIEHMLADLGPKGQRAWDLLDRVADNSLDLGTLLDAYRRNELSLLRERLRDVDLEPHVARWALWLADRVRPDTIAHYQVQIRTLIPAGRAFPRSKFTGPIIAQWLAERTALVQKRRPALAGSRRRPDPAPRSVSGATKRKYLAAARSFASYLVQVGVLPTNPVRDVEAPPQRRPRAVELDLRDVRRVVEGAEPPYRGLFAMLYGAGVEISAALGCVETDVDAQRREVRARGTKAHTRDRVVRIAEWAWPYLAEHLATLTPGERLFRGINRWKVGDVHRDRLRALGLPHHRVHDARHFYAIRAVRAGTPYELVARQLGHADVQMVATVYGRYAPTNDERDRWERIAAELDRADEKPTGHGANAEKSAEMGTATGTSSENEASQPPVSDWPANSRGGTRTHDPGIMSAVL